LIRPAVFIGAEFEARLARIEVAPRVAAFHLKCIAGQPATNPEGEATMASVETVVRAKSSPGLCRDDVAGSLFETVSTRFPVARRLAGSESFDAALNAFMAAEPPGSPMAANYGDAFPQFIRHLGPDACIQYVADIAELEAGCGKAERAAGAAALRGGELAAMPADRLADLRLLFHPAVVLMQSRFPIVSVWQASRNVNAVTLREWRAEAALISRPLCDVEVRRLPPGGFEFLTELSRGATIARSARLAGNKMQDFDLGLNLALLFDANIVIGCW
jgi:Putative DNA-binding domain